ncbi:MAG: glycosyltransferase family 4 protein [Armatimonadota bacterium]
MDTARIAILCPGYDLVMRGVETFIDELTRRLHEQQPEWSFDIYTRAPGRQVNSAIRLIHVPSIDRNGSLATLYAQIGHRLGFFLRTRIDAECLSFTLSAAPKLLHNKYDLIFNQAGPFAGQLLKIKRRRDGTPFIHKTASGYGPIEQIIANQKPDTVVATAPYIGDWLKERVNDVAIERIPNAVDCRIFRMLTAEEMKASHNGLGIIRMNHPVVLFVGAMDPMKRPHLLIEAMSRVPDASLVMIGDGIIKDEVKRLGEEKLGKDRFLHIPRVSREQMPFYFNVCDLFTLPSEEPFGIVFLEAMACNKPVLANNSPVQEWIFGDAGATCDCTNPDEYAGAIKKLLSIDFGSRPSARSREFDWEQISKRYEDLFIRVAASAGRQ